MTDWLVNGEAGAMVAPTDRGLLYGDGLFETVAFHHGRSTLWPLHMHRLRRDCRRLGLPEPDQHLLETECAGLVGDRERAVVRISYTRGSGGSAYFPPRSPAVTRILIRRDFPPDLDRQRRQGITMATSSIRLCAGPLGGIKHLNRLEQVEIARECRRREADEALVLDAEDRIVEALSGNIVIVRNGRLLAPGPHPAAVAGVGLAWLRDRTGGGLEQRWLAAGMLLPDDSIWVINSVCGIRPVAFLDRCPRPVDDDITRSWQQAWHEQIEHPSTT